MKKLNLPPFYIGQKVIYITGISMPKDSVHTVSDMRQNICGCWSIEINGAVIKTIPFKNDGTHVSCDDCNYFEPLRSSHFKLTGWDPRSFRAIKEAKPPPLTFTQIKETEKEEMLILN